jgi:Asp-tRNA(Asn)/Glu-tRNA(Gln) amidotransferase A subunit family amidase
VRGGWMSACRGGWFTGGGEEPRRGTDGRVADGHRDVFADDLLCRERVEAGLAAIERAQPVVNAFTSLCPDRAFGEAGALDRRGRWPAGPLRGCPWWSKDLFDVADVPTSCSSKPGDERCRAYW